VVIDIAFHGIELSFFRLKGFYFPLLLVFAMIAHGRLVAVLELPVYTILFYYNAWLLFEVSE